MLDTIEVPNLSTLLKSMDLRPKIVEMGLGVRDQNPRGTCSVFASTFLLEYMVCKERGVKIQSWPDDQKNRTINFSEEYLNAVANMSRQQLGQTEQRPDGDTFQGCWWGYRDFGIVEEEWFPYQKTFDPNKKPDAELLEIGKATRFLKADIMLSEKNPTQPGWSPKGLSDAQMSAVIHQLDAEVPVSIGVHIAEGLQVVNWGSLSIWDDFPDETKSPCGHSIAIVGYCASKFIPSGGYFVFRNSWGENWGDSGYGYLTFNYARKYVYDAAIYGRAPEFFPGAKKIEKPYKIILRPPTIVEIDKLGKLIHPNSRVH